MKLKFALISLFLITNSDFAFAAACCGSNSSFPSILSGDDQAQITTTFLLGGVVGDQDINGNRTERATGDTENRQSVELSFARLISDRWQAGFRLPLIHRFRSANGSENSETGTGDLAVNVAYEFLPETLYSVWRPKGYAYLQMSFPTGGSRFDTTTTFGLDVRGSGFYEVSAGVLLLKNWHSWDASVSAEVKHPFARSLIEPSSGDEYTYRPGWGYGTTLSVGFSPWAGPVRLGANLGISGRSAIEIEGPFPSQAASERQLDSSLQLSYLFSDTWSGSVTYADSTWHRWGRNTTANRSVSVIIQRRWER